MENLKNMLSLMAFGKHYNELLLSDQECVDQRADDLYEKFDGQISDPMHVITRARFEGI
jgi:hypothetical protein